MYNPQLTHRLLMIEGQIPFGGLVVCLVRLAGIPWDVFIKSSRPYESAYLAWETVRQGRNPFFHKGTGFEGYLIGNCETAPEALQTLLSLGEEILASIPKSYNLEYGFRRKLMQTLYGSAANPRAIHIWGRQLGVILAELRPRVLQNGGSEVFRTQTYRAVDLLPPMFYRYERGVLVQTYFVDPFHNEHYPGKIWAESCLNSRTDRATWELVRQLGRFGHPLVRACMNLPNFNFAAAHG